MSINYTEAEARMQFYAETIEVRPPRTGCCLTMERLRPNF